MSNHHTKSPSEQWFIQLTLDGIVACCTSIRASQNCPDLTDVDDMEIRRAYEILLRVSDRACNAVPPAERMPLDDVPVFAVGPSWPIVDLRTLAKEGA